MNKKTLAKKTTPRNAVQEQRARLARAVAEILTNPQTPVGLYNAVGEEAITWTEAYLNATQHDPARILSDLEHYFRAEAKRTKGGARR